MIQNDPSLAGSIAELSSSYVTSHRRRRNIPVEFVTITCDVNVTSGKSCSSITCLNAFLTNANKQLCNKNQSPTVRFELPNSNPSSSTQAYWLNLNLPSVVKSSIFKLFMNAYD